MKMGHTVILHFFIWLLFMGVQNKYNYMKLREHKTEGGNFLYLALRAKYIAMGNIV